MDGKKLAYKDKKKTEPLNQTKSVFQSSIQVNRDNNSNSNIMPSVQNNLKKQKVNKKTEKNVSKKGSDNMQNLKARVPAGGKAQKQNRAEIFKRNKADADMKKYLEIYEKRKDNKEWQKRHPKAWDYAKKFKALAEKQEEIRFKKFEAEVNNEPQEDIKDEPVELQAARKEFDEIKNSKDQVGDFFKSYSKDNDSENKELEALQNQNEQEKHEEQDNANKESEVEESVQQPQIIEDYMEQKQDNAKEFEIEKSNQQPQIIEDYMVQKQDNAKEFEVEKSDQKSIVIDDYMENPEKYQEKKNISMDMPEKSATVRQRVEEIQNGREQKEKEKKEEKFRSVLQALAEEDEEIDIMNPVPQEFNIIEKSNHEQKQKELEAQKQRELEAQKQRELKAQKQRELEAQKQRELEAQKQKELEEQKQKELEAQKKKEPEAQKEVKMSPSLQKLYEENEEDEEIDIMNPVPQEFNITEKSIREQKKVEEQKESEAQEQKELEEAVEREKKYNDMPEKSATVQQRIDEIQRGRDLEEQKIAQEEQEEIQRKVDLLVKGREQIETEEAVEREKKYNDMPMDKSATVQQRDEEIERGREQEIIKTEAIKQDMPLTVNEKKIENLKQNDSGQQEVKKEGDIRRLKPGEALTRYIKETRSKQAFEKNEKRIPMLEEALQKAEGCCKQIMEESFKESLDLAKLKAKIKLFDAAIIKVDGYIKKSKRFGHKDVTPSANAEERSIREAAKMLRIQLFLEKMVLYEKIDKVETILKEDIDEKELYRMQLDADARMKLYGEYMDKNKAEKEEAVKKNNFAQDMMDRKNKQLIAENSRQMELHSGKISENEKRARLLQEKIIIKNYQVTHKQFNRNEVYKQQVEIKIDELRPVIVKEWLDDNFQQIKDNAGKLIKEIEKDAKDANKIKGIKELEGLDRLLKSELKDDENLATVAMQYQKFFNNMAQMKDGTISLIPREIRDFMAAQIVLFEKRNLLKKDYNDALAKKDEAEKQQVVQKDKEKEKQQVVHKKDEKEKVEERIEEHEKKEGLKGKPEEVQGGSKEDLSQALVPYQKAAQQLEKNNDNSTEFAQMYQSLQSCISMMQNGELKQDVMKQLQEHVYTYMMNLMLKSPQFAFKGKKNGNVPRYGIKNPVLDLRKQMNALAKMNREQKDAVRNLMLLLPVDEKIQELPKVQQESQAIVKHNAIYDYMKLQKNRIEKIAPDTYENIMKLYAEFIWKEQKGSVDDELVQKLQDSLNQLVTKIANAKSPMLKKDSYARTYIKMLPSGQENNHKYDSLIEKRNTIKTFKTAQILLTEPEEVDVRDLGYEPATVREITKEEYEARMKQQNQSENPALAQEEVEKQDESQALVKYSTIYDHMEKQKEIVGKQAPELYSTIMTQLSSYITSMQKGTVTKEMYQSMQRLMNNFISNITIREPKLNEETPLVINLTMTLSNQDFDKMFKAVVQKWNSIRPFRQARKLLAAPQDIKLEEITKDVSVKEENNASDMSLNELAEELKKAHLHEETEKKDTKKVQGVEQAETKKSVHDIFAESIKEFNKEQQSRQQSKTDEALDTKEAKKKLMERIEEKLRKERLARERQNQSDITEKEKEVVAKRKKEEDLEFQRNNNEYGLQGMASEEKEKLDKQKERNEKARIEELERIHKEFDKTHERIDGLTKQIEELRDTRYLGYYSAQGNAVGDALVAMDQAQLEYMEAERKMLIEHMEAQLRILEKIGEVEEYDMDQYNYQEEYHKEFEYAEDIQHELDAKKEEFMKQSEAYEKASAEYKTWFKESLTQVQNLKANAQGMGSMINALEEGMEQMKIEEILYELAKDEENSEETLEMQDIADAVKLIKGIEQTEDDNLYNEELLGEYMEKSGKIAKISKMIQEAYGNWMVNKRDDMSQDE